MLVLLTRIWFPLAVVALLALAIPVLSLVILNVAGQGGAVNEWLLENLNVTFAPPLGLLLILLFVIPAILLLYFLKLKRKPLQVPSTFLWRKSIEDLHVNSLFQWLRRNLLLFLQLLAVLGLIFAVMGFRFHANTTRGKHYILLIDNSASMAATDVAPSRLDWAKEQALKEIDAAGDDDYGMVIVFNSKATTLQGYTNHRAKLREAVLGIQQTHRPTRIEEAITLADSLANPVRSSEDAAVQPEQEETGVGRTYVLPQGIAAEVHLFSDGRFPPLSESVLAGLSSRLAGNTKALGNLNLRYHMAGAPNKGRADNVGIVTFNAVRYTGDLDTKDQDRQKLQVRVAVRSFRLAPLQAVKLRLDVHVDGKLAHVEQRTVRIEEPAAKDEKSDDDEPGEAAAVFILPPLDLRASTVLHAYLDSHEDTFPLDDQAWLVVGAVRKANVLLVTPGNFLLSAFFDQEATRKVAKVHYLDPAELAKESYRKQAHSGELDLVIFDRCRPGDESDLPHANSFLIDRPPPPWLRSARPLKKFVPEPSKRDHPLLRHLTLRDLGVTEGFEFSLDNDLPAELRGKRRLPPLTRILEAGRQVPVLFALQRGTYTDVVMTFPLLNDQGDLATNWPLQPSFPLFWRNVLYHLGNLRETLRENTVQAGEPIVFRAETGVEWLEITPPSGSSRKLERSPRADFVFADTERVGVYRSERSDRVKTSFAVNLLDTNESNIEPRKVIDIGGDKFTAGQERTQPIELWKWLVLAALLVLLVEWYVYNRRIYV